VVSEVEENYRDVLHLILSVISGLKISTVLKSGSGSPTTFKGQRLLTLVKITKRTSPFLILGSCHLLIFCNTE